MRLLEFLYLAFGSFGTEEMSSKNDTTRQEAESRLGLKRRFNGVFFLQEVENKECRKQTLFKSDPEQQLSKLTDTSV